MSTRSMNPRSDNLSTSHGLNLAEFAARIGMRWQVGYWPGDGRIPTTDDATGLAHEIAHYALAAPSRRLRRFYGLGEPRFRESPTVLEEEKHASLLGIGILCAVGAPLQLVAWNLGAHSWDTYSPRDLTACWLLARGLISYRTKRPKYPVARLDTVAAFARRETRRAA